MSQSDFVARGQALVSAGQYQEAVKVCRLGLLGRPTTVEGRVVLGQALLALKRFDEVLAEMRVALELDHQSISAQILKGEALLRKGDSHAAVDVLQRVTLQVPNDAHIASLMSEAQGSLGKPHQTASHPAVGFVGGAPPKLDENTRNYPNHGADEEITGNEEESTGDSYTRPTSIAAPTAKKKTPRPTAAVNTPPPAVLAVGDRSGTVEVDPELDGVELDGEEDFGEIAAPPVERTQGPRINEPRGQVIRSSQKPKAALPGPKATLPGPLGNKPKQKMDISSVELDDDDLDFDETSLPVQAGPSVSTVRSAVSMPSGPLDQRQAPSPAANRPTHIAPAIAPPPHLAQMIANAPHVMQVGQPPPRPLNAALPTIAANPIPLAQTLPAMPMPQLSQAQQQTANAVDDALFSGAQSPAWARSTVAAGQVNRAEDPTQRPAPPPLQQFIQEGSSPAASAIMLEPSQSSARAMKTGMRRRSRMQIIIWFFVGAVVIGGGVFAGFQIRAMRLDKQIDEAKQQAINLAKADTWKGWIGARDRLAGIAQASPTVDNRAALARARALVAFEFGDGVVEAKAVTDGLGGEGGLEGEIAATYLALAQHDVKAARAAADRALALGADDPGALYVSGRAALVAGDLTGAVKQLKATLEKESRPLYAVGLAHALAHSGNLKEAFGVIDKVLADAPEHPSALIERARLLASSGQIAPGAPIGNEVRIQLQKIIGEGAKAAAEQPRGVSVPQVAFANLVLAQVDFLRGDVAAMNNDFAAAIQIGLNEQGFAEQATESLYSVGLLPTAKSAAESVLGQWSQSARGRTAMARIMLALGNPNEAFTYLAKLTDIKDRPQALATRGLVHMALDDVDSARADFDAALKKVPTLELALVGRAWLEIAAGELAEAKQRIEPRYKQQATPALATVYAAILRRDGDKDAREKARVVLEKVANGPTSPDVTRAQLELARIYRDAGDPRATKIYAEASKGGSFEARLENGLLQIETRDPIGGRETLEALLKQTDRPSALLVLETARARLLVGQHAAGAELLDQFDRQSANDKAAALLRWKYDRERGRLALRKTDLAGAATSLSKAIESCGDDAETFLIAAEVAAGDEKQKQLGVRVGELAKVKLKGKAELQVVIGKLLLSKGDEAKKAYDSARQQLDSEKASPRRQAQAYLGKAIVAYNEEQNADVDALNALTLAIDLDPSLYEAYLYYADTAKEKDPKGALAKALLAIQYNPDLVPGYAMVGTIAHKLRNRKLLADMITKLGALAPASEELKLLQGLR